MRHAGETRTRASLVRESRQTLIETYCCMYDTATTERETGKEGRCGETLRAREESEGVLVEAGLELVGVGQYMRAESELV